MTTQTVESAQANVPPAAAAARPAGKARFLYLDNLRMTVITLVVVMHVAITYGSEGNWYYYEAGETNTLAFVIMALLGGIGSAFTMGMLFLIAGYFTPRAYDRKGAGRFLADRFKRLGLPLLFYGVVILPVISYLLDLHEGFQGALGQWLADYFRGVQSLADGPVWFLMELLIFCIFYALWRLVTDRVTKGMPLARLGQTNPPGNWVIAAFALGIGVVTFVVRIWAVVGVYYEPWHLELAHAPQYIALFVVGTMAYRGNWLEKFSEAQVRPWRWIALFFILLMPALVVAAGALSGQLDPQGAGGLNWLSLAYSLWESFICISMVIVVLAWVRKRFNHQGRLAKLMSDNCFAVYILHPIIIVPLALALSGVALNLSLKFVLVAPVAVTLCYLVAYLVRKIPFVSSIL
jgi:surface polysaccharide O-acyltransferase-like enzyme